MGTTSKFSSSSGGSSRPCSAQVQYNDRSGPCKHDGKYPDADGVRWWCGIHNPDRTKAKFQDTTSPIDHEVFVAMETSKQHKDEMVEALEEVQKVLIEIGNTRDTGWPPTTPVEKYKILMNHMADQALEAGRSLAEKISRFRS